MARSFDPKPRLLADLPDPIGFAGMFAGVSRGALVCAGGANFSDVPLAQGGKRVMHDRVFVLEEPEGGWRVAGRLPGPRGYGVSGSWRDAVALVGGWDGKSHCREGWLMRWTGLELSFEALPELPVPLANGCGAIVGDELIVAGGQMAPDAPLAVARCWACDLSASTRGWRELPWPAGAEGRSLAVAGSDRGWFYLIGGVALAAGATPQPVRTYLTDSWRYRAEGGWQRLEDLPRPAAAAPSPALVGPSGELIVLGGIWKEYLEAAAAAPVYPGFCREGLFWSEPPGPWQTRPENTADKTSFPARIVAPVVRWRGGHVIINGEVAPGLRSRGVEYWAE